MELDIDEKEMDYVKHENERDHHWRVVFEGINGGVDYKVLLHAKRWDVYMNEKRFLKEVNILCKFQFMMLIRCFGEF